MPNEPARVWSAVFWRDGRECVEACPSLDEAVELLVDGEADGDLSPVGVKCPDGEFLDFEGLDSFRTAKGRPHPTLIGLGWGRH